MPPSGALATLPSPGDAAGVRIIAAPCEKLQPQGHTEAHSAPVLVLSFRTQNYTEDSGLGGHRRALRDDDIDSASSNSRAVQFAGCSVRKQNVVDSRRGVEEDRYELAA